MSAHLRAAIRARQIESSQAPFLSASIINNDQLETDHGHKKSNKPSIRMLAGWILKKVTRGSKHEFANLMILLLGCYILLRDRRQTKVLMLKHRRAVDFTNNTHFQIAIAIRHECIKAIRKVQDDALLGLVQMTVNSSFPSILLVDPAYHDNVGDNMLTVGEQSFLQNSGWKNKSILECHYVQANFKAPSCRMNIYEMAKTSNIALWHAGGNWGDLWIDAQWPRIESFRDLLRSGFTVIGMPQSMYYKNITMQEQQTQMIISSIMQGLNVKELDSAASLLLAQSKLIFTWREEGSYEEAKRLYPFVTNKLVPDIAFQLGPFVPIRPRNYWQIVDIVVFLRNDYESKVSSRDHNRKTIQQMLDKYSPPARGLTFRMVDWRDRLDIFRTTNKLFDKTSVELLSMGSIVICDRLHAAILSYLSGIPFVYLDQVSNKLTNTLSVAFSSWDGCKDEDRSMMARAYSLQDAVKKAVAMLDKYKLT